MICNQGKWYWRKFKLGCRLQKKKVNDLKRSFENLCDSAKGEIDAIEGAERELLLSEDEIRSAEREKAHYEGIMHNKVLPDIKKAEALCEELQSNCQVVLFELVSGRRNATQANGKSITYFPIKDHLKGAEARMGVGDGHSHPHGCRPADIEIGSGRWGLPMGDPYEMVKLSRDPKTGKINDKLYQFLVSGSTAKSGVVGEISINLADYADSIKPFDVSLPMNPSNSGAVLNVTLQRMQSDVEGRAADEDGSVIMKKQRKTLQSQLSLKGNVVQGNKIPNGVNDISSTEDYSFMDNQSQGKLASGRKCSSFDAISASGSDTSSGQYTPKVGGIKNSDTPLEATVALADSDYRRSGTGQSIGGSTTGSGETESSEGRDAAFALKRQLEMSELELQTLRKQIVKEKGRAQELSRELNSLKEERDVIIREREGIEGSQARTINGEDIANKNGEDPWLMLEETRQELSHEKNLNVNLRLQLQKTQESNSELILAVRDLDELLNLKNRDTKESRNESEEQYDREEIEMQMEQLALDYEILKQENHDISSKLEQTQLREQLRMQYECSAHFAIINDLETYVESLENELQSQSEAFEADLTAITNAKVGQEQRAIQAEEALRKAKANNAVAAERIQEELKVLSTQLSSAFHVNEKLVMEAVAECSELRSQKSQAEERANMELAAVKARYQVKLQQLLCLTDYRTKEADRLHLELENQRKSEERRRRTSLDETMQLKAEIGKLEREKEQLYQQIECYENLEADLERIKGITRENEMLLQEKKLERDSLCAELASMRQIKDGKDTIIGDLNSEVENLRQQCSELEQLLFQLKGSLQEKDSELESNNGSQQFDSLHEKIQLLEGETNLKDAALEDLRDSFLQKEKDYRTKIEEMERRVKMFSGINQGLCEGMVSKWQSNIFNGEHEEMPEEKDIVPSFEQLSSAHLLGECGIATDIVNNITSDAEDKECIDDINNISRATDISFDKSKILEVLSEMALLKESNQSMEAELKEMQERYSDMSLRFAEVEGERQHLVINIRSLKNALRN